MLKIFGLIFSLVIFVVMVGYGGVIVPFAWLTIMNWGKRFF